MLKLSVCLFPFAWNIFTFFLCVSLALKWISYRQYIYMSSLLFSYPAILYLLIERFVHLYLKWLLIGMYILLIVFWFLFCFCSSLCVSSSLFLFVWWFSLVLCLGSFVFIFCVSIVGLWFVGFHEVHICWPMYIAICFKLLSF